LINGNTDLVNGRLEFLFQFVEMVHFVFLGGEVGLCLLDRLLQRLLVLAQLGDVLILLGQFAIERLDLVVLGLFLLLSLQSTEITPLMSRRITYRTPKLHLQSYFFTDVNVHTAGQM